MIRYEIQAKDNFNTVVAYPKKKALSVLFLTLVKSSVVEDIFKLKHVRQR